MCALYYVNVRCLSICILPSPSFILEQAAGTIGGAGPRMRRGPAAGARHPVAAGRTALHRAARGGGGAV
ncbi:hypothetical protein EON63_17330 [archaeon]|nr:MAG: hypothetical protein EON63_17330 [archaeon]